MVEADHVSRVGDLEIIAFRMREKRKPRFERGEMVYMSKRMRIMLNGIWSEMIESIVDWK